MASASRAARSARLAKFGVRTGLVIWFIAPLTAIVVLLLLANRQTLTGPASPVWVTANASTESASIPVDIVLARSAPATLYAPTWSGVVQSVDLEVGARIRDGDSLLRVDGVQRIAARTTEPLYRVISQGVIGNDVMDLNKFLNRQGLPHDQGSTAGSLTVAGIKKFAAKIGADSTTSFDPSWVVYLPSDPFQVMKEVLAVGQTAPGAGSPIATGTPNISSATVVTQGSIPVDSADPAALSADLTKVARLSVKVPDGVALYFGGQEIALSADRKTLSLPGIETIQRLAPATASVVQALLTRPAAKGDVIIPSSALIAGLRGSTCIVRQGDRAPHRVVVVNENNGQSIVQGDVKVGDRVEIFPKGDDRACS